MKSVEWIMKSIEERALEESGWESPEDAWEWLCEMERDITFNYLRCEIIADSIKEALKDTVTDVMVHIDEEGEYAWFYFFGKLNDLEVVLFRGLIDINSSLFNSPKSVRRFVERVVEVIKQTELAVSLL